MIWCCSTSAGSGSPWHSEVRSSTRVTRFVVQLSACAPRSTTSNSGCARWLDQESTKVCFIPPPHAHSRSPTHQQTYQAKERAEKKVSLCDLLTNYITNHWAESGCCMQVRPQVSPVASFAASLN